MSKETTTPEAEPKNLSEMLTKSVNEDRLSRLRSLASDVLDIQRYKARYETRVKMLEELESDIKAFAKDADPLNSYAWENFRNKVATRKGEIVNGQHG